MRPLILVSLDGTPSESASLLSFETFLAQSFIPQLMMEQLREVQSNEVEQSCQSSSPAL